ncbi:MAG: hypothetical protein R3F43_16190 [bacterium]
MTPGRASCSSTKTATSSPGAPAGAGRAAPRAGRPPRQPLGSGAETVPVELVVPEGL